MDCKTFEQRLERYLIGELSLAEHAEMDKHKTTCIRCRASADRATQLHDLLRGGLVAAAAMTPQEQVALRTSVLSQVHKPRPTFRRGWMLRLAGLTTVLAVVIAVGLVLWDRESVSTVSAAEIIAHAQIAMDEHTMSGVLHWETIVEQWTPGSDEAFYHEREIWLDFDDPGRHRLRTAARSQSDGNVSSSLMVCDGVAHVWTYSNYRGEESVDDVTLSPEEMRERALAYEVPFSFHDTLASFADILPDVELAGETTVAGRRAYLLKGQLFTYEQNSQLFTYEQNSMRETPRPVTSTVTLIVDAKTYWLLGQEEVVEGEEHARTIYRTLRFELLPQDQVPQDTFTFTPPEGVKVRRLEGADAFYEPRAPSLTLEEAAAAAPFVFLIPTTVPDDLELWPRVLTYQMNPDRESSDIQYDLRYRGNGTRWMTISEFARPLPPVRAARLVDVGGRQGWLERDLLLDSRFVIYLPDWDVSVQETPPDPDDKRPPGLVILWAHGLTVEEAIAVLESLELYAP